MSLLDAPTYDPRPDNLRRNLLIATGVFILLAFALGFGGFAAGHGWFFSNIPSEHRVNNFFTALEARDYPKAYGIYNNDPDWQQHPDKYTRDYPLKRFTEDWTTESPVKAPITQHQVEISRTDGTGHFGSGVIVAVCVNSRKKVFMFRNKADGTLTWPAAHELGYTSKNCPN